MSSDRIALVFPGQGCQSVGMGRDLYEQFPPARRIYDLADEVLGFPLSRLCFEGPAEELNDTVNTQPAIYTTTLALWSVLSSRLEPAMSRVSCAAGHSLGEFSALAVAEALDFVDGLRLVRRRGEAMRDAGATAPGGMAAVLGLDDGVVREVLEGVNQGEEGVWVANYNSPGQVVIAGREEALREAMRAAEERGAKRVIPLSVSVACHTPYMRAAADRLGAALDEVDLREPRVPVVSNVTASPLSDPAEIRQALLRQLSSPVRWVESVRAMREDGVGAALEVGPRPVVSGLIRRIDREIETQAVTKAEEIESLDWEELIT